MPMNLRNHLLVSISLIPFSLFAQHGTVMEHVEVFVNVNRSAFFNDNTENDFGPGAGFSYVFRPGKRTSAVTGAEYNQTRHFQYHGIQLEADSRDDLELDVHLLSVPVGYRVALGEYQRFFAEGGGYVDIPVRSSVDYYYTSCRPDENGTGMECTTAFQTENGVAKPCMGIYLGLIYRVQIGAIHMAIRPDFKLGFRTIFEGNEEYGYGRYYRLNLIIGLG